MDDGVFRHSLAKIIENILNETNELASNGEMEHYVTFRLTRSSGNDRMTTTI
jgi:hypothetical protein